MNWRLYYSRKGRGGFGIDENSIDENRVDENRVDENRVDENRVDVNSIDENRLSGRIEKVMKKSQYHDKENVAPVH